MTSSRGGGTEFGAFGFPAGGAGRSFVAAVIGGLGVVASGASIGLSCGVLWGWGGMNCALFLLLCQWWWWIFGISVVVVVKAHILPVVMELELPCCRSDWCGSLVGCCGEVCCGGSCDGP